jgi:2-amino-4-hydroxy-6-hydroxymethyldihydropteridine diphosphokinase
LLQAVQRIGALSGVTDLTVSQFYYTSPVSSIPQEYYINAVCSFYTTYTASELFSHLQAVETELGKVPKAKEAPRVIDLDLLFFGDEIHSDPELQIPHPRWQERLFVLIPLLNLIQEIWVGSQKIDLQACLRKCLENDQQSIVLYHEGKTYAQC